MINIIGFEHIFFLGILLISNYFEEHQKVLLNKHLSKIVPLTKLCHPGKLRPLSKHGTVVTSSIKFKTKLHVMVFRFQTK